MYWNHDPCSFETCPFVAEEFKGCYSCRHRQPAGDICSLTRSRLPTTKGRGGCCHWNVELVTGLQMVTPETLAPLGIVGSEPVEELLVSLDAPYELDTAGQLWVDPDRLSVPEFYGLGTEELAPETLDWSEWEKSWLQVD